MKFRSISQMLAPKRINAYLRWTHYVFFIIGILALSYCGLALLDARLYQARQTRRFEQARSDLERSAGSDEHLQQSPLPPPAEETKRVRTPRLGITGGARAPLGRIEMSRIGLSAMIMEGTDDWTLQRAVGHITETALPGETGNIALAGHRDTFFRSLRDIRAGDVIKLKTLDGDFQYRVESIAVVTPNDVRVLQASSGRTLTLITCFPFNYLGSAPNRLVVEAREVGSPPQPTEQ